MLLVASLSSTIPCCPTEALGRRSALILPVKLAPGKFVKFSPLAAGSVDGNLASGTVPEVSCVAFRLVRFVPLVAPKVPVKLAAFILVIALPSIAAEVPFNKLASR